MKELVVLIFLMFVISPISAVACDLFNEIIDGDTSAVSQCIKSGADVNKKSAMAKASPLIIAVNHSDRIPPEIVRLLIDARADVNYVDEYGTTPLVTASKNGYIEVVKLLIGGKANVNIKGGEGKTPLIYAAIEGHLDVVKMLIANGADLSIKDDAGQDALMRSKSWNRAQVSGYLESLQ
jgi:ankyrin repeat protein